jgi:hypothetical protein
MNLSEPERRGLRWRKLVACETFIGTGPDEVKNLEPQMDTNERR